MEIRIFQIVVPVFTILLLSKQFYSFRKGRSTLIESLIITSFCLASMAIALFPDLISDLIAQAFGIKSRVNALLFFAIGLLFYFQLQMYKIIKRQEDEITELNCEIALQNLENERYEV